MMEITPSPDIELTDEQMVEVRRRAKRLGLSTEAYIGIMLKREVSDFEKRVVAAARQVTEECGAAFAAYEAEHGAERRTSRAHQQATSPDERNPLYWHEEAE